MFYIKPHSFDIPIESIMPGGWGNEFDDNEPVNEKEKKAENTEQPQKEEILLSDNVEPLSSKEACTVEVWKDEVIETVTKEMQE